MFEQQERVRDLCALACGDALVLERPRLAVVDPSEPFGVQLHEPHDSRGPLARRFLRSDYGRSCRRAKTTLAGRSASRRMYHAYQNSP